MSHEIYPNGEWECLAIGKHVSTRTVAKGVHACAHCLASLTLDGKQLPFTKADWVKRMRGELNK